MPTLDPTGAYSRTLGFRRITPGFCLQTVDKATLNGRAVVPGQGSLTAYQEWEHDSAHQRKGVAPRDFPVFFSGSSGAGDVATSDGKGNCAVIDPNNHNGVTGVMSLEARAHQVGGAYLGWKDTLLGWELAVPKPAPPTRATEHGGFRLNPGEAIKNGAYSLVMGLDGVCAITVTATGHIHYAFKAGPAGTWAVFQYDGNFVGYYIDLKTGKQEVAFQSGTARKARGGELALFGPNLVIFNAEHIAVWDRG